MLDPVWLAKPARGSRVRERIEAVLDYGKVRGFREGENPARWKGHLEYSLAKPDKVRRRKHHAALPYAELPAFMAELRGVPGLLAARALELTILTAARSGEVRFAKWGEIDPAARVWTVPGERMKGGKEHRVPLSERALAILAALPREGGSDAVFPGRAKGGFINEKAMHRFAGEAVPWRDRARLSLNIPRLGGGDHPLPEPCARNGAGACHRATASRPLTGAATCSRSGRGSWPNGPHIVPRRRSLGKTSCRCGPWGLDTDESVKGASGSRVVVTDLCTKYCQGPRQDQDFS